MHISELMPGDRVLLTEFGETEMGYRRRLLALGVTCGAQVLIVRTAPLGCPVQIEVRGTALTLRKEEARHLKWKRA